MTAVPTRFMPFLAVPILPPHLADKAQRIRGIEAYDSTSKTRVETWGLVAVPVDVPPAGDSVLLMYRVLISTNYAYGG